MGPVSSSKKDSVQNQKTTTMCIYKQNELWRRVSGSWIIQVMETMDSFKKEKEIFSKKKPDLRVCTMASARVPFFKHKQMYNIHQPSNTVIQLKDLKAECGWMVMRKYYF